MKKVFATILILMLLLGVSLSLVGIAGASLDEGDEPGDVKDVGSTEDAKEEEEEIEATEHSREEVDAEEQEELKYEEDEEDDLHIESDDNKIEFESEEPQIKFKYRLPNETEIEFKADDFALIEFVDANGNGQIDGNETLKKLEFDEVLWSFSYNATVENDNTIITAVYYANTSEYEIMLVMWVYQKRAAWNATLVFDVDGGADEVKFDVIIGRWAWLNESSKLALFMELESEVEGVVALESASVDEDQISVKLDSVKLKVGWVKKAKIVAANGTEELVNVTVAYKSLDIEMEQNEVELELDVYFVYPHFGDAKLIHDPSIGVEDDPLLYVFTLINPEILLGTAITTIIIVATAFVCTRRKEKLKPLGTVASASL